MRDKKIFMLDKDVYTEGMVKNVSEKDLEEWVAEEDYNDNYSIIKIDANSYNTVEDALNNEVPFLYHEEYFIFSFGF